MVFHRPRFVLKFLRRRRREGYRNLVKALHNRAMLAKILSGMVLRKFFRRSVKILLICGAAMMITHRGRPLEPVSAVRTFSLYFVIFWALRALFEWFVRFSGQKRISCQGIHQGINLSEQTMRKLKKDRKFFETLSDFKAEGLTERQAVMIREYLKQQNIPAVHIYETIPFSPFVFLGVVLTAAAGGAVLLIWREGLQGWGG